MASGQRPYNCPGQDTLMGAFDGCRQSAVTQARCPLGLCTRGSLCRECFSSLMSLVPPLPPSPCASDTSARPSQPPYRLPVPVSLSSAAQRSSSFGACLVLPRGASPAERTARSLSVRCPVSGHVPFPVSRQCERPRLLVRNCGHPWARLEKEKSYRLSVRAHLKF